MSATVNKVGLKTAEAVNGRAALDWLAANPAPDLVLLDLMMPEMDGFQFLERLREQPERLDGAGRGADREGSDRRGAGVSGRAHHAGADASRAQPIATLGTALAAIAARRRQRCKRTRAPATEVIRCRKFCWSKTTR